MEVKRELGSAPGEKEAGRARQDVFFLCLAELGWRSGSPRLTRSGLGQDMHMVTQKSPPPLSRQRRSCCHGPSGRM